MGAISQKKAALELCTGIAEVTGSNPVEALIFFRLLLSNTFEYLLCSLRVRESNFLFSYLLLKPAVNK